MPRLPEVNPEMRLLLLAVPDVDLTRLNLVESAWILVVAVALEHRVQRANRESFESTYVPGKSKNLNLAPLSNPCSQTFSVRPRVGPEPSCFDPCVFRQPFAELSVVCGCEVLPKSISQIRRFSDVKWSHEATFPDCIAALRRRSSFDNIVRSPSWRIQKKAQLSPPHFHQMIQVHLGSPTCPSTHSCLSS